MARSDVRRLLLWKRGTPLTEAKVVYEGRPTDMVVYAWHDPTKGFERDAVIRTPSFFTSETFLLDKEDEVLQEPQDIRYGAEALEMYKQMTRDDIAKIELYPETMDVLARLREAGLQVGLISNLSTPYMEPFFTLGLDRMMDHAVFSCEVGFVKPEPQIYEAMISKMGLEPSQMLMVGDSSKVGNS
jgi:HAD superfamily hydrolase (TIGR01549 family)